MVCPKCGLQTLPQQKFCRSCGASLQITTQPLGELKRTPAIISEDGTQQPNRLMLWGFIIMFLGAAIGVIGKMLMHEQAVTVFGVLLSLAGMFLTVYPYLSPSPRRRQSFNASSKAELQRESQPVKNLPEESTIEYVPSITERTTNLLKNPVTKRRKQKEGRESQT